MNEDALRALADRWVARYEDDARTEGVLDPVWRICAHELRAVLRDGVLT